MTRLARYVFAALVLATLGAFLVTQRLKQTPRRVQTRSVTEVVSPHVAFRKAGIRIRLKRTDDATVSLLDEDGDAVRRLVRNRRMRAGEPVQLLWNGRDDAGRPVPDGNYRVRVGLRRQGRSVTLIDEIAVDGTPPRPLVRVRRPQDARGPLIFPLPGNRPVRFEVTNATVVGTPVLRVYRTDLPKPKAVTRLPAEPGATEGEWRGPIAGARRPPPGTYAIVAQVRDRAGNVGSSFPFGARPREGDPEGGPGVTVRYLAGQGPPRAVRAGSRVSVFVDSRRLPYRWRLHRLGQTETLARGRGRRPLLRVRIPRRPSGVYLLELRAGGRRAKVPIAVTGPGRQRVLLVLPLVSWQGLNPVDDDGDGLPNTLSRGGPVRLARPFAGRGEPPGFARHESPLLRLLDRPRRRYDVMYDSQLTARSPNFLTRYSGVVLAGNARWLEPRVATRLRRYVTGGGRVFSLGTESLRREVRLRRGLLVRPTGESAFDVFGSRIDPVEPRRIDLLGGDDGIGLFAGGDGSFPDFDGYERTRDPGEGARIVASAQDSAGRQVIVGVRVGRGLVIRTGLPTWGQRLRNPNVSALTRRAWQILGGR
ncbi:MAG TPA: N,N-dimethylformamidase beta subunit family domain-containing protein [Solirubrobacteraceae bacterium]|nr:N,N-dimethylformamidase beta subunit family domain-containing protein [Solirubrobacteraceae bacterium]